MPALAASFTASAILASKEAVSVMAYFVCVTICLMGASIRAIHAIDDSLGIDISKFFSF